MKQTTNYNLVKPELTDSPPDITVMNPNWDTIDEKLREFEEENDNLAEDVDELFQSVSDGKTLVAGAITDKGVNTSPTDTFQTMADNIEDIVTDPSIGTTDAVAGDIFLGKKVVSEGNLLTGTMPNRGAVNQNLTSGGQEYTIPSGYHNGLGKVKAVITGLVASVIKAGVIVGGILGTFTSDATAVDADVLSGKTYYRNGVKGTGSMTDRGTVNQTLTQQGQQYTIAKGKHSGSGKVTANFANLTAENVKYGVNIGGVVGNVEPLPSIITSDMSMMPYNNNEAYIRSLTSQSNVATPFTTSAKLFSIGDSMNTYTFSASKTIYVIDNRGNIQSGTSLSENTLPIIIYNPLGVTVTVNSTESVAYYFRTFIK